MIPMIDDYLQQFVISKLRWLKEHPTMIDMIFQSGRRTTLSKLKDFITKQQIRVVIGYPRDQSQLPAYVIVLAPEDETPSGLGDNFGTYGADPDDYANSDDLIAATMMTATYRIECWSDNGDLTSYMYAILKWCLWTSRKEMLALAWNNITVSGTDLEPVPDYMPIFIYRRAAAVRLSYDCLYHEDIDEFTQWLNPDGTLKEKMAVNMAAIINGTMTIAKESSTQSASDTLYDWNDLVNNPEVTKIEALPSEGDTKRLYLMYYPPIKQGIPYIWNGYEFIKLPNNSSGSYKISDIILVYQP